MTAYSTKIFNWKIIITILLSGGLLIAGLSLFPITQGETPDLIKESAVIVEPTQVASVAILQASSTEEEGTGSSFEAPDRPARLVIKAIGVDAVIQNVGLSSIGNMGIPTNFTDVAWYKDGPKPGMPGSAVMAGHLDGRNTPEAVFYNLSDLKIDDLVEVIDEDNQALSFKVVDVKMYHKNDPTLDVFSNDQSKARLNLITCGGAWLPTQKTYDQRIVIFTELVTAS